MSPLSRLGEGPGVRAVAGASRLTCRASLAAMFRSTIVAGVWPGRSSRNSRSSPTRHQVDVVADGYAVQRLRGQGEDAALETPAPDHSTRAGSMRRRTVSR